MQLFDQFGRQLEFGSGITYPVRKGSRMWMSHGLVVGKGVKNNIHRPLIRVIVPVEGEHGIYARETEITSISRVTKIPLDYIANHHPANYQLLINKLENYE